jgi:hypothetical protein
MISRTWFLPTSEINLMKLIHRMNQSDPTILQVTPALRYILFCQVLLVLCDLIRFSGNSARARTEYPILDLAIVVVVNTARPKPLQAEHAWQDGEYNDELFPT